MSRRHTTKFVIDRRRWARGSKSRGLLYDSDSDTFDCMGQYAYICGISKLELMHRVMPHQLLIVPYQMRWLVLGETSSDAADRLAAINDHIFLDSEKREKEIRAVFKQHGITVVFEGE